MKNEDRRLTIVEHLSEFRRRFIACILCFFVVFCGALLFSDQLYPGNLGYSAERILTFLSLLIPAFSLPETPQLLPVLLRRFSNAPLPILSDS